MAGNFPEEIGVDLVPRVGHDMTWSCDKHNEPIKFFCEFHKLALCLPCSVKDHQKPCKLSDLEDVIKNFGKRLEVKLSQIEETKEELKNFDADITSCQERANGHLETIRNKVKYTFECKLQEGIDKEMRKCNAINQEADEQIRIINEERDARLRKCHEEAEVGRVSIKDCQAGLLKDITRKADEVHRMAAQLKQDTQSKYHAIQDCDEKIKRLLKDNKDLVNHAHQVMASTDEKMLQMNLQLHPVDKFTQKVCSVKLVTGNMGGEFCGRLEGYCGRWEFLDTINIPAIVKKPEIVGHVGEHGIIISDNRYEGDGGLYLSDMNNKETKRIIQGDQNTQIRSCVSVNSSMRVCGKAVRGCTGDSLDGCISLYDHEWKLIRDITIPRNTENHCTLVHVDVDNSGMILAAERGQSNIYVINPADGGIVQTITARDAEIRGPIRALPSGDIIVETFGRLLSLLSRSGVVKKVIDDRAWHLTRKCKFDILTDALYVTYDDREVGGFSVDQVTTDGVIQARRIVHYVRHHDGSLVSTLLPWDFTRSGKLVFQSGHTISIYYKKM